MAEDKLHTVEGAAAFLGGLSKYTIAAWLSRGKLPRTKVGARTMIRESDLQAFIAGCNLPKKAAAPVVVLDPATERAFDLFYHPDFDIPADFDELPGNELSAWCGQEN